MNERERRSQRIFDEVQLIVENAPTDPDERSKYVIERCESLVDSGWNQVDYREVEVRVRTRLGLPQW